MSRLSAITMALEEITEDLTGDPPMDMIEIEDANAVAVNDEQQTQVMADSIDDAQLAVDTLGETEAMLEGKIEDDEPISHEAALAIESMLASYSALTGYQRKGVKVPGMESYAQAGLVTTQELLRDVKKMRGDLSKAVAVAQEGFIARVGNAFKRLFTTQKKIYATIDANIEKLHANGSRSDTLKDVPWGRVFANHGRTIDGAMVLSTIKNLEKAHREMTRHIEAAARMMLDVAARINNPKYILASDSKTVDELKRIRAEGIDLLDLLSKIIPTHMQAAVDARPLSYEQAKALWAAIKNLHSDADFYAASRKCADAWFTVSQQLHYQMNNRIGGAFHSDIREANTITYTAFGPISQLLRGLESAEWKIFYGVHRYISASAN